ncbi:MAG: iron-containing alcohol dehydrogenase, partial [Nocardiopsaceae bacterium]|nr:iron-containing alcohol dehydrogenase [Nocardiopsaceae bacterium]
MTSVTHPALRRKSWDVTADGEFYMPTRAFFGRGIAGQVAGHATALMADAALGAHGSSPGVLLVTDPGVRAAGLVAPAEAALTGAGFAVTVFDQVRPNPADTDCLAGAELIRAGSQRLLVA